MPFQTFTPPPSPPMRRGTPLPPPRLDTRVTISQLPVAKRMSRKRFWPMMGAFIFLCLLFEPVRILGVMLLFFWIVAIGVMPHVAVLKVMSGSHRR